MSVRIMIVNDNPEDLKQLSSILVKEGHNIFCAGKENLTNNYISDIDPDIIILDVAVQDTDGFEICRLLKNDTQLRDIPIIMIPSKTEPGDIKKALERGIFDFIKRPINEGEVIARIQSAIRLKEYQNQLRDMAMKDGLTGIYNHRLLIELFEIEYLKQLRKGESLAFVMIDIDYFERINDTFGHMAGDEILKEIASILTRMIRKSDIVGRYSGEAFSIVLTDATYEDVICICERIRGNIEKYNFRIDGTAVNITASIGVYFKQAYDGIGYLDMVGKSDYALCQAKSKGRNRVEIYSVE